MGAENAEQRGGWAQFDPSRWGNKRAELTFIAIKNEGMCRREGGAKSLA